jgi:hypothetical protein
MQMVAAARKSAVVAQLATIGRGAVEADRGALWLVALVTCLVLGCEVARGWAWLHLQLFWAEDFGWWLDAYQHGLTSLLIPQAGYMQTVPRLVALLEVHFAPLSLAPTVSFWAASLLNLIPVLYLLSHRSTPVSRSFAIRAAIAGLTVVVPAAAESIGNITNVQWHLALAALLVVLARPPRSRFGQAADLFVLLLSGLSGPFVIPLVVLALWYWRGSNHPLAVVRGSVMGLCAGVEVLAWILTHGSRSTGASLGATWDLLGGIVGWRVVAEGTLGVAGARWLYDADTWGIWLPALLAVAGAGVLLYAALRGPAPIRLFLAYGAALLAAALLAPLGPRWWSQMAAVGNGPRYYYMITLAWACVLLWLLVTRRPAIVRVLAGIGVTVLLLIGVRQDWSAPPLREDGGFHAAARTFDTARSNQVVAIPGSLPPYASVPVLHR